jgi:uncharacterized protein YgiM (DUF1202 family)
MTHRKTLQVIVFALVLAIIASLISFASAERVSPGTYAYINVETYLRLRDAPQGTIMGQVKRGTRVYVISGPDRDHYYQVDVNGGCYFVYGGDNWEYLSSTKPGSTPTTTETTTTTTTTTTSSQSGKSKEPTSLGIAAVANGEMIQAATCLDYSKVLKDYSSDEGVIMFVCTKSAPLALRSSPSESAARRDLLLRGEIVTAYPYTRTGGFIKVKAWMDGRSGWVHAQYLNEEMPEGIMYIWDVGNGMLNMVFGEGQCFAGCAENCPCQDEGCDEWRQMFYGEN